MPIVLVIAGFLIIVLVTKSIVTLCTASWIDPVSEFLVALYCLIGADGFNRMWYMGNNSWISRIYS